MKIDTKQQTSRLRKFACFFSIFTLKKSILSSGFTLMELVIVIAILGIITTVTGPMIYSATRSAEQQYRTNQLVGESRVAMERMMRELRAIRSNSATDLSTGSHSITFNDIDGNSITYSVSGDNLLRNGDVLATHVSDLTFTYQDNDGNNTTTGTDVRYVTISLSVEDEGKTVSAQNTVFIFAQERGV